MTGVNTMSLATSSSPVQMPERCNHLKDILDMLRRSVALEVQTGVREEFYSKTLPETRSSSALPKIWQTYWVLPGPGLKL